MSFAGELLKASRTDVFRLKDGMTARQLAGLDLRLVQSYKRTENTIEVKFVDVMKLCEIADRCDGGAVGGGQENRGGARLRELLGVCADAADADEDGSEEV